MHSDLHNILQGYLFYTYTLKLPDLKKSLKKANSTIKTLFKSISNKKKVPGDVEDTWGLAIHFEVNKEFPLTFV